mmetsp:Transcript_16531/g.37744  ORF Transcript_16531/g.37744 Transcript_16531/m.37744 type:complete len:83 (-) Transcript_16531:9-257(-)
MFPRKTPSMAINFQELMEFEQGLIRFRREDRTTRYKSDETASSDKEISRRRKQGTRAGHRRELARKRAGRERGEGGVGVWFL